MEALADADLVLIVLDASQPCILEDEELLRHAQNRPTIIASNKCDFGRQWSISGPVANPQKVRTSALTGEGISELRSEILRHIGGEIGGEIGGKSGAQAEAGFLTNIRHQRLVKIPSPALEAGQHCGSRQNPA